VEPDKSQDTDLIISVSYNGKLIDGNYYASKSKSSRSIVTTHHKSTFTSKLQLLYNNLKVEIGKIMNGSTFAIDYDESTHEICQFTADTIKFGSTVLHKLKVIKSTNFIEPGNLDLCVFPKEIIKASDLDILAEALGRVGDQHREHQEDGMNDDEEGATTVVKIIRNGRIFNNRYFAQDNSKSKGCLSQPFCEKLVPNVSVNDPLTLDNIHEIVNDEFQNRGEKCTASDFHICRLTVMTDRISDAKNAEIATLCEIFKKKKKSEN
jgi:hypothetical protein